MLRCVPKGARVRLGEADALRFRAVREGLVAVSLDSSQGRRQILCLTGPGELVCPGVPREGGTRIEALAASRVCEIDLRTEGARLARDPDFAAQMYELTARGLAQAAARLVALGRLDGTTRLTGFLAEMAGRLGERTDGTLHLVLPMTREDIADCLGLNAETVSRILTRLRKAGLLRMRTPTLMEVPDPEALAAHALPQPVDT